MALENENLLQPLLPPQSPTTNSDIALRLLSVIFIGLISIWANHESSRFFDITIVNEFGDTPSGKLFNLRYVSNDKASNMILEATTSVGHLLYNQTHVTLMKKLINHVTLRAVDGDNLTNLVTVDFRSIEGGYRQFTINVSLSVVEKDPRMGMVCAVRRGMARVWLWDTITKSSSSKVTDLIESVIEYVAAPPSVAGDDVEQLYSPTDVKKKKKKKKKKKNPRVLGDLLSRCERTNQGFVRRLVDRAFTDRWREGEELLQWCEKSVENDGNKKTNVAWIYDT